jgi:hypothetical protein
MFAPDLYHSRIEYLSNYIDLKRQSEAIPQIFNLQYSIPACPGWAVLSSTCPFWRTVPLSETPG